MTTVIKLQVVWSLLVVCSSFDLNAYDEIAGNCIIELIYLISFYCCIMYHIHMVKKRNEFHAYMRFT